MKLEINDLELYDFLLKVRQEFCGEQMKWIDASDDEKALVFGNINGFCGFLTREIEKAKTITVKS